MQSNEKYIKLLLEALESRKLLKSLNRTLHFYDEPQFFQYNATLNLFKLKESKEETATGTSFTSKYTALLKCLSETVERFSLYNFWENSIIYSSYRDLQKEALNPSLYKKDSKLVETQKFGWVRGYNLTSGTNCFLPAQLIYVNYLKNHLEAQLSSIISTGAAGGFDHYFVILQGIYEVIERDAFMTIYLNKIRTKRIKLSSIKNKRVHFILEACQRYKLEVFSFDISNDLGIPTFLSIIVDRTSLGSAVSLGAKTSCHAIEAIIGSLEESFSPRSWIRGEIYKRKSNNFQINPKRIKTFLERGLFWASPKMLKNLHFLLEQKEQSIKIYPFAKTGKEELEEVIERIAKRGFLVFYTDISPNFLKNSNFLAYKVLIPGLQPLYLDENNKEYDFRRLAAVSRYFGQRKLNINKLPHPFL